MQRRTGVRLSMEYFLRQMGEQLREQDAPATLGIRFSEVEDVLSLRHGAHEVGNGNQALMSKREPHRGGILLRVGTVYAPNPDAERHSGWERAWANGQVARSIVSPRW